MNVLGWQRSPALPRLALWVTLVTAGHPSAGWSQVMPIGPEFPLPGARSAVDANGNLLVVFSAADGNSTGVAWQRFDVSGTPTSASFQVNTYTTGTQYRAQVAIADSGDFIVAWESRDQESPTSGLGVYGQVFDAAGAPRGGEFQVNSYTTLRQYDIAVSTLGDRDFLVIWANRLSGSHWTDSTFDVVGQRYDVFGTPLGGNFSAGSRGGGNPSVAADQDGDFVVVWDGVFGRRFDRSAQPTSYEFWVHAYPAAAGGRGPCVASNPDGSFIVAWAFNPIYLSGDPRPPGVFVNRFDASGNRVGLQLRVNANTAASVGAPSVALDPMGNFLVTWDEEDGDGHLAGIRGRFYDASGSPVGGEFVVNSYTTDNQTAPSVVAVDKGNFVLTWITQMNSPPWTAEVRARRVATDLIFLDGFE